MTTRDDQPITGTAPDSRPWWSDAVFYQVYPRSFSDSNGDGVGDLSGVVDRLGYLELLGIDAIWLSPVMRSPMADHGYDVSDPRDIDPLFGDLATMDTLIAEAHARGIRVTMDLVPNHTSDQHPWFREALAAGPGSSARERYIFRDGRGPGGSEPPNNWPSVFGGPAWTRITESDGSPGQWYLHIFAAEQPDLNWDHPRCSTTSRRRCDSGCTAASTASGSTSRTAWPSPRVCPTTTGTPTRCSATRTTIPGSTIRRCTRSTGASAR